MLFFATLAGKGFSPWPLGRWEMFFHSCCRKSNQASHYQRGASLAQIPCKYNNKKHLLEIQQITNQEFSDCLYLSKSLKINELRKLGWIWAPLAGFLQSNY